MLSMFSRGMGHHFNFVPPIERGLFELETLQGIMTDTNVSQQQSSGAYWTHTWNAHKESAYLLQFFSVYQIADTLCKMIRSYFPS